MLLEHFKCIIDYHHDRRAVVDVRRIGCWYLKKTAGTRQFRDAISHVESIEKAMEIIENFVVEEETAAEQNIQEEEASSCVC